MTTIRVSLPGHLRALAAVGSELRIEVADPPTIRSALDALEERFPVLRGTIRDRETGERRALMRYYACGRDLSLDPQDTELPAAVVEGREPLQVVGAIAGG